MTLFADTEKQASERDAGKLIPEKKLKGVTGGAFDDVPTVDENEYDDQTKYVSVSR